MARICVWARRLAIGMLALAGLGAAGIAFTYPAIAAAACPACFDLDRVSAGLIVSRDMPAPERERLARHVENARGSAEAYLGVSEARALFVVCDTEACDRRLGGMGARATTYSTPFGSVIRVSPRGANPTIIAHELAHVIVHERVGVSRLLSGSLPAWFDEGLAVIVSDDGRYLRPGSRAAERCTQRPTRLLPTSAFEWAPMAGREPAIYAEAACAVLEWMEANGGPEGARAVLDAIAAGEAIVLRQPIHKRS